MLVVDGKGDVDVVPSVVVVGTTTVVTGGQELEELEVDVDVVPSVVVVGTTTVVVGTTTVVTLGQEHN